MPERDLYQILGVQKTDSADDIKSAYRKLARKHHPDVNPGNKVAEERFKEISAAFEVLGNPDKRKLYDEFGAEAAKAGTSIPRKPRPTAGTTGVPGRPLAGGNRSTAEASPSISETSSGTSSAAGRVPGAVDPCRSGPWTTRPTARRRTSNPIWRSTSPSPVSGSERQIRIQRPEECPTCHGVGATKVETCPRCGGSGHVQISRGPLRAMGVCPECDGGGQIVKEVCKTCKGVGTLEKDATLVVKIPKGAVNGTIVRLAGQGAAGTHGGPAGDALLRITLRPHPLVRLDGRDLSFDLPVTVGEAVTGAEVQIPSFEGDLKLKIPAGSPSGRKLRLKGKGLPDLRGTGRGDLYAVLMVVVP